MAKIKITAISDTHGYYPEIPKTDILIHLGDFSEKGTQEEFNWFLRYLLMYEKNFDTFILIPGNHDVFVFNNHTYCEQKLKEALPNHNMNIGFNNFLKIDGIRCYCYSYQGTDSHWSYYKNSGERKSDWIRTINSNPIDLLLTHQPPFGIMDIDHKGVHKGCKYILGAIHFMEPKYHLFGHIHDSFGSQLIDGTTFVNCSHRNYFTGVRHPPYQCEFELAG